MDYITSTINDIDSMINSLIAPYENAVQLLCTIPGIKRDSAITITSEIGADMSQFSSSKRLCCWAGLISESLEAS
ncbi:transposase [Clostridium kluyveri]